MSLSVLAFFASLYGLIAFIASQNMPEWTPMFVALGVTYGVTFFAVAAEWFWGRWVATGLGYAGGTMTIAGIVMGGGQISTPLVVFGLSHGALALSLAGEKMAARFEGQSAWLKEMSPEAIVKLRKTVTRAASSLPGILMMALKPRTQAALFARADIFMIVAVVLLIVAIVALVSGRAWGYVSLLLALVVYFFAPANNAALASTAFFGGNIVRWLPEVTSVWLLAATLPLLLPTIRFLFAEERAHSRLG